VPLVLRRGAAGRVLPQVVRETKAGAVRWNRRYDAAGVGIDKALKERLRADGVEVASDNGTLLAEPFAVTKGDGGPFKVFTPFWKAAREVLGTPRQPLPRPRNLDGWTGTCRSERLGDWALQPKTPDWAGGMAACWTPGEAGARERLSDFLEERLAGYKAKRDEPAAEVTSRLSPHLAFGEISPGVIWHAANARREDAGDAAVDKFLSEVGWREFSYALLWQFPALHTENFNPRFDRFPWRSDTAHLEAWRRGRTGYPIVDAGMRELWHEGWMHNRVRMVVASFLVKHLLIDWREGEAWFWDTLVDADPANNAASWQWVAGSGADAAPYFRIFNPVLQGEKFDGRGGYVRKWVPELAKLPDKYLMKPWEAPRGVLKDAGVTLGRDYPDPIVDHDAARDRALAAFARIKDG